MSAMNELVQATLLSAIVAIFWAAVPTHAVPERCQDCKKQADCGRPGIDGQGTKWIAQPLVCAKPTRGSKCKCYPQPKDEAELKDKLKITEDVPQDRAAVFKAFWENGPAEGFTVAAKAGEVSAPVDMGNAFPDKAGFSKNCFTGLSQWAGDVVKCKDKK